MIKILVFAEGVSLAHPSRVSEICRQLQGSDFEFHIATPVGFHWIFKDMPNVYLYDHSTISNETFNQRLFHVKFPYTWDELQIFQQADGELIKQIKPAMIISDFRLTAFVVAKKMGIPFVNLIHFHWHPSFKREPLLPYVKTVSIWGRRLSHVVAPFVAPLILKQQTNFINHFMEKHNFPAVKSIYEFYSAGDYKIFPDMMSLFDNPSLTSNEHFVGPFLWKNKETPWPSHWPRTTTARKTVYVTMGSTGNHQLVPKLVKNLSPEKYRIFISTSGHRYPDLENRANVYLSDFVPAELVLSMADVLICNGGTSTTYQAISLGVPFFAFPLNMDQYLNCHQLKYKNVADYDHFDTLDFTTMDARLDRLMASGEIRNNIDFLKREIREIQERNPLKDVLKRVGV
ncbi:MAG: hypothetical protein JNL11_19405 [Bdellovibrionaceae bacterium]|nr:hypothetical protein [Pseudobdellovibrionaceae bacterium]